MKSELRTQGEFEADIETDDIDIMDEIRQDDGRSEKSDHKLSFWQKYSLETLKNRIKYLNGDPHYVAMGMAIGVFIAITPTIPFHMVLAVLLAIMLKGSKPAAIIGVWLSNPVTIPIFYLASYKAGAYILGHKIPFDQKYDSILELAKIGMDATLAMLLGGILIGIPSAIFAYFLTKSVVMKYREKRAKKKASSLKTVHHASET